MSSESPNHFEFNANFSDKKRPLSAKPLRIERNGSAGIIIKWSDGTLHQISSATLREHCPSAVSRAKRGDSSHDAPLTASVKKSAILKVVEHTSQEELRLENIWAIGRYALGMRWGDGHDTGIYPFALLYELGELDMRLNNDPCNNSAEKTQQNNSNSSKIESSAA
jgi:DUF971 family protein